MEFTGIVAVALIAAILAVVMEQYKPEFSILIVAAAGCGILIMILASVIPALDRVRELIAEAGLSAEYFGVLFKALGICYITQFAGDMCRDAGQTSMAGKIDLAGKTAVVLLALPLLSTLVELIVSLI